MVSQELNKTEGTYQACAEKKKKKKISSSDGNDRGKGLHSSKQELSAFLSKVNQELIC